MNKIWLTELDVVVNYVHRLYKGLGAAMVEKPWLPPLEHKLITKAITTGHDVGLIDTYNLAVPIGMVSGICRAGHKAPQ